MTKSAEQYYFPVDAGNRLVNTASEKEEKNGMDNEDWHYDEIDSNGIIVARYDVWDYQDIYPPQKSDTGWKKYDLVGNVIARGKSYDLPD